MGDLSADAAEAIRITCPADPDKFLEYYNGTAELRKLPKSHLHVHYGTSVRNCEVKKALNDFNSDPENMVKFRENFEKQAEEDLKNDDLLPQFKDRKHKQLPLVSGPKLCLPDIFWDENGSLKNSAYEWPALDACCPWSGFTGWNPPDNLWHGMGGCRDYGLVMGALGKIDALHTDNLDYWVAASEDARAEGIRWVEYCGCRLPEHTTTDAGDLEITEDAYKAWRDTYILRRHNHCIAKVPEVGIGYIITPFGRFPAAAYARAFVNFYKQDAEIQAILIGVGQVGTCDPHASDGGSETISDAFKIYIEAGLPAVCVHMGEWTPARKEAVEESKAAMSAGLDMGVKRIGHGIIAHVDDDLMKKIKDADVCLEVCPISNRVLDNVPDGLKTHPLRILFEAGVPCALASDDPAHQGSPNGHGLVREYAVARDLLGFTAEELAKLAKNSFIYSCAPEAVKEAALQDIDEWLATEQAKRTF